MKFAVICVSSRSIQFYESTWCPKVSEQVSSLCIIFIEIRVLTSLRAAFILKEPKYVC